jgi:hypothetical protein
VGKPWEEPGLTPEERAHRVRLRCPSDSWYDAQKACEEACRAARLDALREAEGVCRAKGGPVTTSDSYDDGWNGAAAACASAIAALGGRDNG